jgi:osmotically-inducible protein OsmY
MVASRVGLVAALLGIGCLMPAAAQAQEQPTAANITYWVQNALRDDPRVPADLITVTTEHGIVTLAGSVPNVAAKQYADAEAKKINGVLGVVDQLTVTPTDRSDRSIAQDVRFHIVDSPVVESRNLKVTCDHDEVTLTGQVATPTERQQAGLCAGEVAGVAKVANYLVPYLKPENRRTNEAIKNDVVATLERDVYLDGLPIEVNVKQGRVMLSGSVGDAYQKQLATDDALQVLGVKAVDNELRLDRWEREGIRNAKPILSDSELRAAAQAALNEDTRLNASRVVVLVSHGVVRLEGLAADPYQERVAAEDIRNLVGTHSTADDLFVRHSFLGDAAIQDNVEGAISRDRWLHGLNINASVHGGVVRLWGTVDSWHQRMEADRVALRVAGVQHVINDLVVNEVVAHSDAALTKTIQAELARNWGTREVAPDIRVEVRNGEVILTGHVTTWAEQREAGNIALNTAGVWQVQNRLAVGGYEQPLARMYFPRP